MYHFYRADIHELYDKYKASKGQFHIAMFDNDSAACYQFIVTAKDLPALAKEYFSLNDDHLIMMVQQRFIPSTHDQRAYICKNRGQISCSVIGTKETYARIAMAMKSVNLANYDIYDIENPPEIHKAYEEYTTTVLKVRSGEVCIADLFAAYRKVTHLARTLNE